MHVDNVSRTVFRATAQTNIAARAPSAKATWAAGPAVALQDDTTLAACVHRDLVWPRLGSRKSMSGFRRRERAEKFPMLGLLQSLHPRGQSKCNRSARRMGFGDDAAHRESVSRQNLSAVAHAGILSTRGAQRCAVAQMTRTHAT